ncbi:MAG: T9SS type A sorting domain-containing protein [Bacteroidota bacterium]
MKKYLLAAAACGFLSLAHAQFAPQVGFAGTTAMHKDSAVFVNWATGCSIARGWQDVADTTLGKAQVGDETYVPGKAGNGVVSLGDGGSAVITFEKPVMNGAGYDFAVFENGFIDQTLDPGNAFLELAFVEVSSDGISYFRFDAESTNDTTTQRASFEAMNAVKINNLAGKYIANYGTPFDLDELKDKPGLDVSNITHVRIIDVTGSINPVHASRDSKGAIINDPYPTAFASGGFDLDGVGVIHQNNLSAVSKIGFGRQSVAIFPNPANTHHDVTISTPLPVAVFCYDITGKQPDIIKYTDKGNEQRLQFTEPGMYFIKCISGNEQVIKRIVVQ